MSLVFRREWKAAEERVSGGEVRLTARERMIELEVRSKRADAA